MGETQSKQRYWKVLSAAFGVGIGFLLGFAAWGDGRSPILAVLLPIVVALAPSRATAFAIAFGYVLGVERTGPGYIATWFDNNLWIGIAIWLGSAVIGGAAWSLAWTSSALPWRKALATVIAWLVTLVPPVAILAMGHTTVAWGYMLPGWGWVGLALSALVPAAVVWGFATYPRIRKGHIASLTGIGCLIFAASFQYEAPNTRYLGDMVAVSTKWGPAKDPVEILTRVEKMGQTVRKLGAEKLASVVIYPESILQTYDPALFPILSQEVLAPAAEAGQTFLISMDLVDKDGNFQTVATAVYPDGRSASANARQPVPLALWMPWRGSNTFLADWTASNILALKEGVKARIVFCYEEYIPILSLINEAKDDHNLVVVMANTWAANSDLASHIQALHSQGIASMFGKPILRSENRSRPESNQK